VKVEKRQLCPQVVGSVARVWRNRADRFGLISVGGCGGEQMPDQPPAGVASEIWAKLDPTLRKALQLNADSSVDLPVVILLVGQRDTTGSGSSPDLPRLTRQERFRAAQEREAAFAAEVADLLNVLHGYGATEVQPLWLNRTVAARIPLPGIESVARRPDTKQIVLAVPQRVTA
jgi:hypothetical protein